MNPYPTKIELAPDSYLVIAWSDGTRRRYRFGELRDICPCATCREKRNAPPPSPLELRILSPQEAQPLRINGMRPVGNYAYSIDFSDGHDTGIFSLELLHSIGEEVTA